MIGIKRITTGDSQYYDYMEQLLTNSFPVEEYRDLKDLRVYTDTLHNFFCNIIFDVTIPIGLVTYWDLEEFYYVEHFAIDPQQRNGGYGGKLLEHLAESLKKPIVLEVEYPTDEMAQRRINFYQRHGYTLWEKEYVQPPYRTGYNEIPMFLMVQGCLDPEMDFEAVKRQLHHTVYKYS